MKHCIIVKFKPDIELSEHLSDIKDIFERTNSIPGIHGTEFKTGLNRERGNRYDLMIEMDMDAEALPAYDACDAHKEWKNKYGGMIEAKCIFDHEG